MKRFDPGVAFARRFIDQEMGTRLALKAWYCDSTSRYTETANLQPVDRKERPMRSGLKVTQKLTESPTISWAMEVT